MKGLVISLVFILILAACSAKKGMVQVSTNDSVVNESDTVEYELLTFDSKFELWYDLNDSPSLYRSKEFYESWNKQYVSAWNIKTLQDPFFEPIVGYDYGVDYGFELNHRLFYYFQYVERVLKKPILSGAAPNIMILN